MSNNIEIDIGAKESASGEIGKVGDAAKSASKVIVGSMGDSEQAFDTAARGTGKLGDALDKTEGVTGKLGDGVSGVSDVISSFNDISNHGAEKQRALARAQIDVKQASNDVKQAIEDAAQAQRDLAQSGIDASQAQLDEKQALQDQANAQKQYNSDVKQYGANSSQAKQDLIDLTQAQIDQKQAVEDGKQAQRDANQAHIDGTQAQIDQKGATVDLAEAQSNLSSETSKLGKIADYANMFGGALSGLSGVIGIITVAQWAWNSSILSSPITWIVLAIAAVIAIIVLLATKTQFFQTIWKAVWGFMKDVGAWFAGPFKNAMLDVWHALEVAVKFIAKIYIDEFKIVWSVFKAIGAWFSGPFVNFFKTAWHAITAAFSAAKSTLGGALDWVVKKGTSFVNYFLSIPGKLAGKLGGMFSPVWNGFRVMLNNVIRGWNSLRFTVPGFSFLGYSVPSFSLGVPHIPFLAKGGDVLKSGLAYIHEGERVMDKSDTQQYDRTQHKAAYGHAEPLEIRIILEFDTTGTGDRIVDEVLEGVRSYVKASGGGNVQVALGRGSQS